MRNSSLCVRKRSIKKLITRIDICSTHHTTLCWLYIYAAASYNILKYCDSWQFTDEETRIYLSMVTFLAQADIGTLHQISLYPFLLSFKCVTLWRRHTPLYSTFCTLSLWNITLRFFLMPSNATQKCMIIATPLTLKPWIQFPFLSHILIFLFQEVESSYFQKKKKWHEAIKNFF